MMTDCNAPSTAAIRLAWALELAGYPDVTITSADTRACHVEILSEGEGEVINLPVSNNPADNLLAGRAWVGRVQSGRGLSDWLSRAGQDKTSA